MFVKNEVIKEITAKVIAQAENAIGKQLTDLEKTFVEFSCHNAIADFAKTLDEN